MNFSKRLPDQKSYSILHFRTNAYQCKPLVVLKKKPLTLKVKHLFLLKDLQSLCLVLGIEIYVYLTFQNDELSRHIFILKADTTGLGSSRFSAAGFVLEVLQYLVNLNPEEYYETASYWYSEKNKSCIVTPQENHTQSQSTVESNNSARESVYPLVTDLLSLSQKLSKDPAFYLQISYYLDKSLVKKTHGLPFTKPAKMVNKISLFTRSANAYIFPESHRNEGKHVASGNELFTWWINLLAKTFEQSWDCKADIPGADARSVERFLPNQPNWSRGNIYVSAGDKMTAINCIPLFPDDPKGRFLEHLIVENRYKGLSTTRYWDELGFRQEFRLGNVVGIIGCNGTKKDVEGEKEDPYLMLVTRKQYKKVHDLIKGEDYTKTEEVKELCESTIEHFVTRMGINLKESVVVGSKVNSSKALTSLNPKIITNLTSLVKKRKKQ